MARPADGDSSASTSEARVLIPKVSTLEKAAVRMAGGTVQVSGNGRREEYAGRVMSTQALGDT